MQLVSLSVFSARFSTAAPAHEQAWLSVLKTEENTEKDQRKHITGPVVHAELTRGDREREMS